MPNPLPIDGRLRFFVDLRPDLIIEEEHDVPIVARVIHEVEGTIGDEAGESTPTLIYFVLDLDAHGAVLDDWAPVELAAAKAFAPPGAEWQELPDNAGEAVTFVRNRLSG